MAKTKPPDPFADTLAADDAAIRDAPPLVKTLLAAAAEPAPTTSLPSIDRKPRSKTPMSTIVRAVAVIDRVLTKLGNDDARRRVVRMVNELVAEPLLEGIQ